MPLPRAMMLATLIHARASSSVTRHVLEQAEAEPAVLLGDHDAEEAHLPHLGDELVGHLALHGSSSLARGSTSFMANWRARSRMTTRSSVAYAAGSPLGAAGSRSIERDTTPGLPSATSHRPHGPAREPVADGIVVEWPWHRGTATRFRRRNG